jgi:transposase
VKVVEVAERVGVSRQTVRAWLARYGQGGLGWLAEVDIVDRTNGC